MEKAIRQLFPSLFPRTLDCSELDGFINIAGNYVRLQVHSKNGTIHAHVRWASGKKETCLGTSLKHDSSQRCSLLHFLTSLKEKLEKHEQTRNTTHINSCAYYLRSVIGNLDSLGWETLDSVDDNLKFIILKAFDEAERKHLLKVYFPDDSSDVPLTFEADLPRPFVPSQEAQKDVKQLYFDFQEILGSYQCLWNILEEIDENTWVLEPENPSWKDATRRIAISKKASIIISVNISQPTSLPDCEFLGSDKDVSPLRNIFLSSTDIWNEDVSVLTNLKNILGITFPTVLTTTKDEIQEVCVICYSFRLNGNLPEKTCENMQCKQTFHVECLYEWLHKLSTTRHSFNILFGECPYCSKPITCKVP